MNKITESHLRSLGFQKELVMYHSEDNGDGGYYYYGMDINNITLITNSDDEIVDNNWGVGVLEGGIKEINDLDDLVRLIHLLKKYENK